jgi:hypothetical protein
MSLAPPGKTGRHSRDTGKTGRRGDSPDEKKKGQANFTTKRPANQRAAKTALSAANHKRAQRHG